MADKPETLPEPLKMGLLKYMRADGAAWGGFASCREGDVGAFPVIALKDHQTTLREAIKGATLKALEEAAKLCDVTPPYPFRASLEAGNAIRKLMEDQQ